MSVTIYYDGDCPFCTQYVRYLRLTEAAGVPQQVDVRQDRNRLKSLESAGFDLDKGMVAEVSGRLYGGADAMHVLALLTSPSGAFNKISRWIFSNGFAAAVIYPLLRMCRNLVLLFLDRTPITESRDTSLLTLVSACLGMFAFLHFLVYKFDFLIEPLATTYVIPALGVWLLFHPGSRLTLLLLLGVMAVDAWWHMPVLSNHTILKNFVLLAAVVGGIYHSLRGTSWAEAFNDVAPVGRALLLTMYVFGVFHKINSDFLNPAVSCANTLWAQMPYPLYLFEATWFSYTTVYGTLVIESLILLFLLLPSLRHIGIVAGISFHMMLALSNFALYTAFSMFSMFLHVLFLTDSSAKQILESPLWRRAMSLWQTVPGKLVILWYGMILVLAAYSANFPVVSLVWFAVALPLLWLILRNGRDVDDRRRLGIFVSRRIWLNLISVAFLFNCITPYLGLKNAQSMNMFANLRLEGGASNHLILRNAPGPFGYLEDLVSIKNSGGVPYLDYIRTEGLHLTYYDLLNHLERHPAALVSYERGGNLYTNQSAATLDDEIERTLHPRWFRKWFHFAPIDLANPKPCARDR